MAKDSKNRALEMRKTDNRLSVSKPKISHLVAMDMEKRRKHRGQKSTLERIHETSD